MAEKGKGGWGGGWRGEKRERRGGASREGLPLSAVCAHACEQQFIRIAGARLVPGPREDGEGIGVRGQGGGVPLQV